MGMDVSGINANSPDGEYFRANVWSWRLIHVMMALANEMTDGKAVPQEEWEGMHHNDGHGLKTQEECNFLADTLETILGNNKALRDFGLIVSAKEDEVKISFPVPDDGMAIDSRNNNFVTEEDREKVPVECLASPYSIHMSHAKDFIKFLRDCGGFEVW